MENKKNSITQTQILNDINKIIDQSLNTITNKIEEENKYDNKQIEKFNLNLEKVEKKLSNAFINMEKTINEDFNKKNISKTNQKKEEDLINICSEIFNDKINNLKNMIPNEINNFNQKVLKYNNDLISSFNIIKETIKNNLNIKKNNNNKINNNYNNNNNINDINNNYNNNNQNRGYIRNNNQNRGYSGNNDKNDKNQIKLDGMIISPKEKVKVNSLDIKNGKFSITLDIKNNGKNPLNKECFIEGESENLFIEKYHLSKPIMKTESLKVEINIKYKDMNGKKINSIQKLNIILYDDYRNKLHSLDIQVEIMKIQEMIEQNEIDDYYQGNKEQNQNERNFQQNFERLKIKFPKTNTIILMSGLEAAQGDYEQAVELIKMSIE